MKISLSWLKQYIRIQRSPEQLSELLTQTGLEVEALERFESVPGGLEGFVIGEVLECQPHPNADKLTLTRVDIGKETAAAIVCGAPNVEVGQKVVVATVGSTVHPTSGEPFKLKKVKFRGIESQGMICAEDEIGLGTNHDGIMVLDTDLANGTPAAWHFDVESDYVYEIGLTPNRADATSHIGVARDIKAVLGNELKYPNVESFSVDNHELPIQVIVEDSEGCPRYSGVVITGVEIRESPEWLRTRLRSIGLAPINNVVDITNFVLHELGQPLHAFDADKIQGKKIVVKTLPEGSEFLALDERSMVLRGNDLMVCDAKEGLCIAGVFGGLSSGVTEKTANVFLESAYFSPDYIRKTSQYHTLKTDASFRFERGTDPNLTVYAMKRAALLIKEIAGGTISSEIVDVYPKPIDNFQVQVKFRNIDRLVGQKIQEDEIWEILKRLDIKVQQKTEDSFLVSVPLYRVDVQREADVIEEILRIYGYNNIEIGHDLSSSYLAKFPEVDEDRIQYNLSSVLAANGFNEIITNSLTRPEYAEETPNLDTQNNVTILNKREDLGVLRQSISHSGLEVISHNINRKQTDLRLFEFGKVYSRLGKNSHAVEGYSERRNLCIFITGKRTGDTWIQKSQAADFSDISGIVTRVLNQFGISGLKQSFETDSLLGTGLSYWRDDKTVLQMGFINTEILQLFDIEQEVLYAEMDWDHLLEHKTPGKKARPIPKYPEVKRDLSLVIDRLTNFDQIEQILDRPEFGLIKEVSVFDVFEGKNIGDDKKAYALSFILQDEGKTLNEKSIGRTMTKLMNSFERELGALIRK